MKLQNMFKKNPKSYIPLKSERPEVPEGLLKKCNKCGAAILTEEVKSAGYVCPKCQGYFRVHAYERIRMTVDENSFEEWEKDMEFVNPLEFKGYEEKIKSLKEKTGLSEAVVTGKASIEGNPAVIAVCDGRFLMASMGQVVGEKIARAVERATKEQLPVIIFACSGGARMQEGIVSLMQMAKTAAALKQHSDAGLLYVSVLTDPTTGGVTASFAMLGDVILAEPKALIGFAGPRVIEQTIGEKLPKGFQRSEFLLEHGFIDRIVERKEMRTVLGNILQMHQNFKGSVTQSPIQTVEKERQSVQEKDAWERVTISRKNDRPVGQDYIRTLFSDFLEFHGDRCYGDDPAIIGGIARFAGIPVTVIAQAKGKSTKENVEHHFGMPSPEGYRKALRLMKQAEKFKRPILLFVDTPGAFCGVEAEERGQGEAIARNLFEMSSMKVPILSVVIGEGGSGGALALAVADEVWMLENAIYSVLSPEGFASILWKDSKRASEAAAVMKLTAADLKKLGVIEAVIAEPEVYTEETMQSVVFVLQKKITEFLDTHCNFSPEELAVQRYERFRKM
ncbi:acetyl-CoA carboxylase carboxyltransferase subunit alpha [Mediterraneibacter gnavus]|uniref:acetyl-CoA carboxylase carboxyltransferase subunit alpha n=1 Tax=Mediterraneibacter gnavus TaxID=33038 RepID=UPI00232F6ED6|nr:acetyl-CoA carboxylase carboxyltransferase subunit alpha [Mediterraneibacter gnavus]MDB8709603.1 acetyl-CoA carboxylase carboxyltransferase subunit alpha [Mediterraneibacter gnavus]MDB8712369.1 acetyl-CoA carboxylase carboxyltransferase subunit alpha [Mediterraneibacter gnavus]